MPSPSLAEVDLSAVPRMKRARNRSPASLARVKEWTRANPERKAEADRRWAEENRERKNAAWRAYGERNRETRNAAALEYYYRTRDIRAQKAKEWRAANKSRVRGHGAARRARERNALPAWADHAVIAEFYERAADISRVTGCPHHVDHIVPLAGRTVCGLHVEHNLQILPARENHSKRNRFNE